MPYTDAEAVAAFHACSNQGRWGPDDELGTLNYITPEMRLAAAALVRSGDAVALGKDFNTNETSPGAQVAMHYMHLSNHPFSVLDSIHLQIHGETITHMDALAHMFWNGVGYNNRQQDVVVTFEGVTANSVHAMRDGIVARGVFLDVAAAAGRPWLETDEVVTPELLDAAVVASGVTVSSGDAVFVHTGLERRQAARGPEDVSVRCGLDHASVVWLHRREVSVFGGDCTEQLPGPGGAVPFPLHQIGISAMGLALLDNPTLTPLLQATTTHSSIEFMLVIAPLRIPGATGSPVNPIAIF